jgi:NIPSNAP
MTKVSFFVILSCAIFSNAFSHSLTAPGYATPANAAPGYAAFAYATPDYAAPAHTSTCKDYAAAGFSPKQEYFSLRIYQLKTTDQESRVDKYLQNAFLPALHRLGIPKVGVFKPVGNDTAAIHRIYVLITFRSLEEFVSLTGSLQKDAQYLSDGKDYLDAEYNNAPYERIESILLQAFPDAPQLLSPETLKTPITERFYELRAYESPTEKLFANKIKMFNQGGEVALFKKHDCNAIFYGSVLAGAHQPNLMYMLGFDSMTARDEHWKAFGTDPITKQIFTDAEYQHNMSHVDQIFLHPTAYSDL